MMTVRLFRILFLFSLVGGMYAAKGLELVKRIGDDRDDYIFFRISGAALGPQKNIYISDAGGYFISAYDWQGKYLNRFGSYGQGPNEIQRVRNLQIYKEILYFWDGDNRRIGRLRLDLTPLDFIPVRPPLSLRRTVSVTNHDMMWAGISDISSAQGRGKVVLLDGQGNPKRIFFDIDQFGAKLKKSGNKMGWVISQITGEVLVAAIPDSSQVLVGFSYPDNPVVFYLFNEDGNKLKKIEMPQPESYRFAHYATSYPFTYSAEGDRFLYVNSLFANSRGYWVHITRWWANGDKKEQQREESAVLIYLDRQGRQLAEYKIEAGLVLFGVSDDGYVLGTVEDDEIPCLRIYQIPGW